MMLVIGIYQDFNYFQLDCDGEQLRLAIMPGASAGSYNLIMV